MAEGPYNLTTASNLLKTVYRDKITDTVIKSDFLLSSLEKADPEVWTGGKKIEWAVDVAPQTGNYAINNMDGGLLPKPAVRDTVPANADVADHSATTGITVDQLDRMKKGETAYANGLQKAVDDCVKDLRRKVSPQLYRNQVWTVAADSTGTTVTLDQVQYIQVGDYLTFGNRTSGAGATVRKVTGKSISANTITVDSAVTVTAAASGAWYSGAGPTDTVKIESLDLAAAGVEVSTGAITARTLHGINSGTNSTWAGNEKNLSGNAADEDDFYDVMDSMWGREAEAPTEGVTTRGIQRRLMSTYQSQKRYVDTVEVRAGFKGIFLAAPTGELGLVAQPDVPKGRAYMWNRKAVELFKGPSEWLDGPDGDTIWRWTVDQSTGQYRAQHEATYRLKLNLLFDKPAGIGRLYNCADDKPNIGG